jgi:hypothetical protein
MPCSTPRVPVVVNETDFLSKTTDVAATALYTPGEDQNLRISLYGETFSWGASGTQVEAVLTWNDDNGAQSSHALAGFPSIIAGGGAANPPRNYTTVLRAKSGNAVSLQLTANGGTYPGGGSYSVYATVEKI